MSTEDEIRDRIHLAFDTENPRPEAAAEILAALRSQNAKVPATRIGGGTLTRARLAWITAPLVAVVAAATLFGFAHIPPAASTPGSAGSAVYPTEGALQAADAVVAPTDLSAPRDYPDASTHLDPPTSGAQPAVSAATVEAACSTLGSGVQCEAGSPTKVELALVTDKGMGFDHRLVWALTWRGVDCEVMGPPRPSSAPTPVYDPHTACEFVSFVDTNTGRTLFSILGGFTQ